LLLVIFSQFFLRNFLPIFVVLPSSLPFFRFLLLDEKLESENSK
jgi:hypothetical protein